MKTIMENGNKNQAPSKLSASHTCSDLQLGPDQEIQMYKLEEDDEQAISRSESLNFANLDHFSLQRFADNLANMNRSFTFNNFKRFGTFSSGLSNVLESNGDELDEGELGPAKAPPLVRRKLNRNDQSIFNTRSINEGNLTLENKVFLQAWTRMVKSIIKYASRVQSASLKSVLPRA